MERKSLPALNVGKQKFGEHGTKTKDLRLEAYKSWHVDLDGPYLQMYIIAEGANVSPIGKASAVKLGEPQVILWMTMWGSVTLRNREHAAKPLSLTMW